MEIVRLRKPGERSSWQRSSNRVATILGTQKANRLWLPLLLHEILTVQAG